MLNPDMPIDEWQPIETAPKDGSRILGYDEETEQRTVVFWHKGFETWELNVSGAYAESGEWSPTHWMPLPNPPTNRNEEEV